jgi:hypothetical protein
VRVWEGPGVSWGLEGLEGSGRVQEGPGGSWRVRDGWRVWEGPGSSNLKNIELFHLLFKNKLKLLFLSCFIC